MQATALGHRLETLHDGLTTFRDREQVPMPLVGTTIAVRVVSGLAFVLTTRSFRNAEKTPIEAVMTFPVGFDAVVTGLAARIGERRMIAVAQERGEARETYETALNDGKLSVLHEEALRGIHILSIGALPPGAEVYVEIEQTVPLTDIGGVPFLRLPMTAGQLYGASPLLPSDDLITANVRHVAALSVTLDEGHAILEGNTLIPNQALEIVMDRAVELRVEGGCFGKLTGRAADGRTVSLTLEQVGSGDDALDLHIIMDRSGSTNSIVSDGTATVWQAMRDGLATELVRMRVTDRVSLWQFDSDCQFLGTAIGPASTKLTEKIEGPRGGTELSRAIRAALAKGARDILVLTDGRTWAHMVEELKSECARISAILVGPQSLDANIGHLCAMTGGQVLYAPGRDVASALHSAFTALRHAGSGAVQGRIAQVGPINLSTLRGGVKLLAEWSNQEADDNDDSLTVGRFAAALALPLLPEGQTEAFSRAHSLCTHLTSLVLVDATSEATEGFSRMRKVPLSASTSSVSLDDAQTENLLKSTRAMSIATPRMRSLNTSMQEPLLRLQSAVGIARSAKFSLIQKSTMPNASFQTKSAPKGILKRILEWLGQSEQASDLTLFSGFLWDVYGDELLAGNFQQLSSKQMTEVKLLAKQIKSASTSADIQTTDKGNALILALGLIASRSEGRAAERFARRVLKDAPIWLLALT